MSGRFVIGWFVCTVALFWAGLVSWMDKDFYTSMNLFVAGILVLSFTIVLVVYYWVSRAFRRPQTTDIKEK